MFRIQCRIPLFLLAGLLATSTACYSAYSTSSSPGGTPQPVAKHLSTFNPIEGTNYLIANISTDPAERAQESYSPFSWTERGYSGSSGYEIYNYVFFDNETGAFNKLLSTNEDVVLQIIGFPSGTPTEKPEDFQPVKWWLYILVKEDTNNNNVLDYKDKLTAGVTDVGGNVSADVIADVDSVLGYTLTKDQNTLFVIYHSQDKNYVAKIDLPGRQVVSTNEINLGEDVK